MIYFQVYLVVGGFDQSWGKLASTELLVHGGTEWKMSGALPFGRSGVRGVSVDNKIFISGTLNLSSFTIFFAM